MGAQSPSLSPTTDHYTAANVGLKTISEYNRWRPSWQLAGRLQTPKLDPRNGWKPPDSTDPPCPVSKVLAAPCHQAQILPNWFLDHHSGLSPSSLHSHQICPVEQLWDVVEQEILLIVVQELSDALLSI